MRNGTRLDGVVARQMISSSAALKPRRASPKEHVTDKVAFFRSSSLDANLNHGFSSSKKRDGASVVLLGDRSKER